MSSENSKQGNCHEERAAGARQSRQGPGRPQVYTEAERTGRIIRAAESVFITAGYGAATMEQIAREAGMSKKTLYALYPDKQSLLAAVSVAADDFPWDETGEAEADDPYAELRRRLLLAAEFVLTARQVFLTRLMISEAAHSPQLAVNFHERVISRCRAYIIAALGPCVADREPCPGENLSQLAGVLLGAAMGDLHMRALFGKSEPPQRAAIVKHVDAALRVCGLARGDEKT